VTKPTWREADITPQERHITKKTAIGPEGREGTYPSALCFSHIEDRTHTSLDTKHGWKKPERSAQNAESWQKLNTRKKASKKGGEAGESILQKSRTQNATLAT